MIMGVRGDSGKWKLGRGERKQRVSEWESERVNERVSERVSERVRERVRVRVIEREREREKRKTIRKQISKDFFLRLRQSHHFQPKTFDANVVVVVSSLCKKWGKKIISTFVHIIHYSGKKRSSDDYSPFPGTGKHHALNQFVKFN